MAKEDDSELDTWRYRYPSAGVSWNFIGDPAYCQRFVGEAKNMLYQVKNRMNIAVPKLKSLEDGRRCKDGTTIIVKSVFGQDFINIDASLAIGGRGQCTITFYNLPLSVPPMQNPGEIKATDVQGVDYFKTYYRVEKKSCRDCSDVKWNLCLDPAICRPFYFVDPTIPYHDVPAPSEDDPKNHCQYSSWNYCQAEIIESGRDSGGTFIIWKAYTEWSDLNPTGVTFSRDGLGWMRMRARIEDQNGLEICFAEATVRVDCCLKPTDERPVIMYWEKCTGGEWCAIPPNISQTDLMYFWTLGGWISVALRTILPTTEKFACLPFEWELNGPGELIKYPLTHLVDYKISMNELASAGCSTPINIKVRDRCGVEDEVTIDPCCPSEDSVEMHYTSLIMSCSGSQTLTVTGGCAPYSWGTTFGSIAPTDESGGSAILQAPADNTNCTSNPTVTVTDCCGDSASVTFAVNCYSGNEAALGIAEAEHIANCQYNYSWCSISHFNPPRYYAVWALHTMRWRCDGVVLYENSLECARCAKDSGCTDYSDNGTFICPYCGAGTPCPGGSCEENVLKDCRTTAMKEQGCCPLNPLTGLPY